MNSPITSPKRFNYLWLAHSKLRACSFGPELRTGPLPGHRCGGRRASAAAMR